MARQQHHLDQTNNIQTRNRNLYEQNPKDIVNTQMVAHQFPLRVETKVHQKNHHMLLMTVIKMIMSHQRTKQRVYTKIKHHGEKPCGLLKDLTKRLCILPHPSLSVISFSASIHACFPTLLRAVLLHLPKHMNEERVTKITRSLKGSVFWYFSYCFVSFGIVS
jgi:hypothetical protein